jgi:hypothetical protein
MNDDRNFEAKKAWLLLLLDLRMPHEVIEKMLDISASTCNNYQNILKSKKELKYPLTQYSQRERMVFKLFADLKTSPERLKLPEEFEKQLIKTLTEIIGEKDIIRIMECSMPAILSFQKRCFDESVTNGYRKLIDDICGDYLGRGKDFFHDSDFYARGQWQKYLEDISTEKIPLPTNVKFDWNKHHFVRDILQTIANNSRGYSVSLITPDTCKLIDNLIFTLPDDKKKIIIKYYGLDLNDPIGEKKSMVEIASHLNVGVERVRQMKEKILRYLRGNLENYNIKNPSWENVRKLTEDMEKKIITNEKENEQHYLDLLLKNDGAGNSSLSDFAIESTNKVFLLKITELNFSRRVVNVLKYSDIHNVYQLAQMNEFKLKKYRNMGENSVKEIKSILASHKINLGTIFSEKEKLYYEFMTRADK